MLGSAAELDDAQVGGCCRAHAGSPLVCARKLFAATQSRLVTKQLTPRARLPKLR